jgi:hypothetical protein
MMDAETQEIARAMAIPFEPDHVSPPTLARCADVQLGTTIYYISFEGERIRVTFDGLDAIKASRGEYLPFPTADPILSDGSSDFHSSLYVVEHSRWLRERYAYESSHYQNWTVDRMMSDGDHYLFAFHSEFIEVIATGIWFERYGQPHDTDAAQKGHPLLALPASTVTERFVVEGIRCQVRANPKPIEDLLWGARYCSQPLFDFHLEESSHASGLATPIWYRLTVRERRYQVQSTLQRFGEPTAMWPGVVTLAQVKPLVEAEIRAIRERQRQMGR